MKVYTDRLKAVIEKFRKSAPLELRSFGEAYAGRYQGRIPYGVLELWDEIGIGLFWEGYFQLCDPAVYQPIINAIFEKDEQIRGERTHAIGFSAFGELITWNEDHRDVLIDLVNGQVSCRWLLNDKEGIDPNITILTNLLLADNAAFDVVDAEGKGLFKSAQSTLGNLKMGQIYGFKPILALGGSRSIDGLGIWDAFAHMSILAQAQTLNLMDNSVFPPQPVRPIG
jgi:hypothetical protein